MVRDVKVGKSGFNRRFFNPLSIFIILILILQAKGEVFAEGSRDLYPSGATGSRGDLEWRISTYGPAGSTIKRRTLLQVFAQKDEYILMGSSAVGVVSSGVIQGDILVYNPGLVTGSPGKESVPASGSFDCNVQRVSLGASHGQITSRTQELAGPQAVSGGGNPTGYVPCFYIAPSTGIYDVVIYGPDGFSSDNETSPTGEISLASAGNFNNAQSTNVAAWDVTVRSSDPISTTDIKGRLFADYLAQITGGNGRPLNSSLYVVTVDGFQYRADLNGMDPYGFLFYGNRAGFFNSDGATPLYHDVLSTVGATNANQLTQLQGGVHMAPPQFPVFFNPPDPAVLTALGIPTSPALPNLNTFKFTGTAGGSQSYFGTGGIFSFQSNATGFFDIIVSRDGVNFDPTNPLNRVMHAFGTVGSNSITWDGKDNNGNPFPVGSYQVHSTLHAGELHMALIDVENSAQGGPSYTLLNPPGGTCPIGCSTAFYDDRGYQTMSGVTVGTVGSILCGTDPPTIPEAVVGGFDSTTNQRAFGTSSGGNAGTPCNGSFGDTKGLDLWTYFPSNVALSVVVIVPPGTPKEKKCGNSTDPGCANNILPATGFAPNMRTSLPLQPPDLSYADMGDFWLEIPSQNVQQNIIAVPDSSKGWDVSWLGNDIGYLEGTAFPTWAGNSVLAGHVYSADGKPGPFVNIGKMGWGQQVVIHGWGQKYVFEVRTVDNWVDPSDTSSITKHEDYPWITLVTCRGYDQQSNSYNYRTVVRAVLVKVEPDK